MTIASGIALFFAMALSLRFRSPSILLWCRVRYRMVELKGARGNGCIDRRLHFHFLRIIRFNYGRGFDG